MLLSILISGKHFVIDALSVENFVIGQHLIYYRCTLLQKIIVIDEFSIENSVIYQFFYKHEVIDYLFFGKCC